MSRKVKIASLSDDEKEIITKDLEIKIEGSKYIQNSNPIYLYPYAITDNNVYIPFAYGKKYLRPERKKLKTISQVFDGELRKEQIEVKDEAIDHLNKTGSTVISSYCGFGKTFLGIYIATRIKLKTIIIVNRLVLIEQWKESINMFCPKAIVQVLTTKSEDESADFYIMNAINVPKLGKKFFKYIGMVIVDELHLIMSEMLSQCMQSLVPRYLLGLSATPYRTDGFEPLINLYFGDRRINRKLFREHLVFKVSTDFIPEQERAKNGRINWSSVIDSQANNVDRNELIIKIIKHFHDRVFLVLVKRISQGDYLFERLQEEKVDVTSLMGKNQEYNKKSRVLVGTTGKCSVGFNHPLLNTLIMGADIVSYWIQVMGRIMRTKDGVPMVFDLVDNNPLLVKHFRERRAVYIEHGGKIKEFSKEFPEFIK
jgi:superfamily II DNA or RNA helicase